MSILDISSHVDLKPYFKDLKKVFPRIKETICLNSYEITLREFLTIVYDCSHIHHLIFENCKIELGEGKIKNLYCLSSIKFQNNFSES